MSRKLLKCAVMVFLAISLAYAEDSISIYDKLNNQFGSQSQAFTEGPNIKCPPTIRIAFKAVDAESGSPIPVFRVTKGDYSFCSDSGELENGIYYAYEPKDALYKLFVKAENYELGFFEFDFRKLDDKTKTNLIKGTIEPFIIKLSPAKGLVRGRVLEAVTMKPLKNVSVSPLGGGVRNDVSDISEAGGMRVVTASDGSFQIEGLRLKPVSQSTRLCFTLEGYVNKEVNIKRSAWKEDVGDILLLRFANLSGVLLDKNKQPVVGRVVYLLTPKEFKTRDTGKLTERTNTGKQGYFTLTNIPPGDYIVLYGSSESDIQRLSLGSAENKILRLMQH